jgi:hypothetical protein
LSRAVVCLKQGLDGDRAEWRFCDGRRLYDRVGRLSGEYAAILFKRPLQRFDFCTRELVSKLSPPTGIPSQDHAVADDVILHDGIGQAPAALIIANGL